MPERTSRRAATASAMVLAEDPKKVAVRIFDAVSLYLPPGRARQARSIKATIFDGVAEALKPARTAAASALTQREKPGALSILVAYFGGKYRTTITSDDMCLSFDSGLVEIATKNLPKKKARPK